MRTRYRGREGIERGVDVGRGVGVAVGAVRACRVAVAARWSAAEDSEVGSETFSATVFVLGGQDRAPPTSTANTTTAANPSPINRQKRRRCLPNMPAFFPFLVQVSVRTG